MNKYTCTLILLILSFQLNAQQVLIYKDQKHLVPEGIAIDPRNGNIYISSIARKKIIRIQENGTAENFIEEEQDGFLEGLGMKVDLRRNCLWALSNIRKGKSFTSQIHAFDLATGKLRHRFTIEDTLPRLLNDLVVDPSGILYITDTYHSALYTYSVKKKKLDVLVRDTARLQWPNGIVRAKKNKIILASYGHGPVQVDLRSGSIQPILGFEDKNLAYGLDGLVLYRSFLYCVYNAGGKGYPSNAVIRYTLDKKKERITAEQIIDNGNPAFADPTTAAFFAKKLYVIANSHLDQFNANKERVDGIEGSLTPLTILVYQLK